MGTDSEDAVDVTSLYVPQDYNFFSVDADIETFTTTISQQKTHNVLPVQPLTAFAPPSEKAPPSTPAVALETPPAPTIESPPPPASAPPVAVAEAFPTTPVAPATLFGGGAAVPSYTNVIGTAAHDTLSGGGGTHLVQGLAGNDVLYAHDAFTSKGTQGAFTPKNVSGLQLWLDGADSTTLFADTAGTVAITDGASVALWKDKSGLGNDIAQATITNQPLWVTNGINSKASVTVDGNDRIFGAIATLGQIESFIVFRSSGIPAGDYNTVLAHNNAVNDVLISYGAAYTNRVVHGGNYRINGSSLFASGSANDVASRTNNTVLYDVIYVNSTDLVAGNIGIGGRIDDGNVNTYIRGTYGDVIVFNAALPTASRQLVELYQSAKWGIALATTGVVADSVGIF